VIHPCRRLIAGHTKPPRCSSLESSPEHRRKTPKVNGHRRTQINTTRFARYFALPIVSAGIIGGAALGLAGTASAANTDAVRPPAIVATPDVKAHPAPEAVPGAYWHRGVHQVDVLQPGYIR
jgi:hypothetical protein